MIPLQLAHPTRPSATDRTIVKTALLGAPRGEVWEAWTTGAKLVAFLGRRAIVEPWPGGRFEPLFLLDHPTGNQGAEGCRILSVLPERMLSFTWNAPPNFLDERHQHTWVVLEFSEVPGGTQVILNHLGWPAEGGRWGEVFDYFDHAWTMVFSRMQEVFGPIAPGSVQRGQHRRIDYLEFVTVDMAVTKTFYGAVFGWKFTDYGPEYVAFEDGRLAGGFRLASADEAAFVRSGRQPLVIIYAADLEAVQAALLAAGGRAQSPIVEFPGGRRFEFTDPCGVRLALWSDRRVDGVLIA